MTAEDLIAYPYGLAVIDEGKLWFSDASSNIISLYHQRHNLHY